MRTTCMATKTISLRLDAYERLRNARRSKEESFTHVILRATWSESMTTAGELLDWLKSEGPTFSNEDLDRMEESKRDQQLPEDKWTEE